MKIALLILLANSFALAFDSSKCSSMMNNGLYKKYKFGGVGEANSKAMTGETKSAGTTKATSRMSTEGSTAILDPKYTTNVSVSGSQGTSSWGQCSAFGLLERREQRELYVAQNFDQIKKDIANGKGEHLNTLSWYALCENDATVSYSKTLQNSFEVLANSAQPQFTKALDGIVEGIPALKAKCFNLSQL
jgi:hypothetical protein